MDVSNFSKNDTGQNRSESSAMTTLKYGLGAVVLVLVLSLFSKWTDSEVKRYSPKCINQIKRLVRHSAQYATIANQDKDPLIALMHTNFALAYANSAKNLIPSKEIERIANVNLDELISVLEEEQLIAMQRLNQFCPQLQPDGVFAANTGWLA